MNIPSSVLNKVGLNLHNRPSHPIQIVKQLVFDYFKTNVSTDYKTFDDLPPKVSVIDNFDSLLIPVTHPARSKSDTYYFDDATVLRTHTSAHQVELLKSGHRKFLVAGDVYRKDEIDRTHYPVFHQMEGVCLLEEYDNPKERLIGTLSKLVEYLFPNCEYRFNEDYFPFTDPSFEVEVKYESKWLEILGCGVIRTEIL